MLSTVTHLAFPFLWVGSHSSSLQKLGKLRMVFYIFYVKLEFPDWVPQHMVLFLLGSGGLTKEFSLFCLSHAGV